MRFNPRQHSGDGTFRTVATYLAGKLEAGKAIAYSNGDKNPYLIAISLDEKSDGVPRPVGTDGGMYFKANIASVPSSSDVSIFTVQGD